MKIFVASYMWVNEDHLPVCCVLGAYTTPELAQQAIRSNVYSDNESREWEQEKFEDGDIKLTLNVWDNLVWDDGGDQVICAWVCTVTLDQMPEADLFDVWLSS